MKKLPIKVGEKYIILRNQGEYFEIYGDFIGKTVEVIRIDLGRASVKFSHGGMASVPLKNLKRLEDTNAQ